MVQNVIKETCEETKLLVRKNRKKYGAVTTNRMDIGENEYVDENKSFIFIIP